MKSLQLLKLCSFDII